MQWEWLLHLSNDSDNCTCITPVRAADRRARLSPVILSCPPADTPPRPSSTSVQRITTTDISPPTSPRMWGSWYLSRQVHWQEYSLASDFLRMFNKKKQIQPLEKLIFDILDGLQYCNYRMFAISSRRRNWIKKLKSYSECIFKGKILKCSIHS